MKYLLITIGLILFAALTKAQKINPYMLTDRQVDSLHAVLAQTGNDSIKMELNGILALYYGEIDTDSSIYFFNQLLAWATKLDLSLWKAGALDYVCSLYDSEGDYPKAWQANQAAFQILNDEAADKNIYPPRFMTGIPPWLTSWECQLSAAYFSQAFIYESTKEYDKAATSMAKAIRIAEKTSDKESLSAYLRMYAYIYWDLNKLDSAILLQQKSLALSQELKSEIPGNDSHLTLGQLYHANGNNSAALHNLRISAGIGHQQHNFILEFDADINIGFVFISMRQPDSAIAYCSLARAFISRVQAGDIANVYETLFSAYQMKNNRDSTLKYLLLTKHLRDSLNTADRVQADQYKAMVVKQQFSRQEAEAEKSRQQANLLTYATLGALVVASLILFLLYRNNRQRQKTNKALTAVRDLQDKKISQLDEAVTKRTEQLNSFRQVMATDFHDQTGNMLSTITRQAMLLKLKLNGTNKDVLPVVESIITNSNDLYDSSKDFLWNLNHNSDDPLEVFHYLTNYGQVFFNQFNIPFSSSIKGGVQPLQQLDSFAALNLIYIFKEGMTNVVKHAEASEVMIEMEYRDSRVVFALQDNGRWKPKDESTSHHGLGNMERRCEKNKFGFLLSRQENGTRIEITLPVTIDFIS